MPLFNKYSVSNLLIAWAFVWMLVWMLFPSLASYYGMNTYFYMRWDYGRWILQMFTSQFLHGSVFHFLANAAFIYYFGNGLEILLGKTKMLVFFVFSALITGIGLTFFAWNVNTIGMSSFALAIISYYTIQLWSIHNPEYKGWISAIVANLAIGFIPGVSFMGHFIGMLAGGLFWVWDNFFKKIRIK